MTPKYTLSGVEWLVIIPTFLYFLPCIGLAIDRHNGAFLLLPFLGLSPAPTASFGALACIVFWILTFLILVILAWRLKSWPLAWLYCLLITASSLVSLFRMSWVLGWTD